MIKQFQYDTLLCWRINNLCNLSCSYCHMPLKGRQDTTANKPIAADDLLRFIEYLSCKCNIFFTGGEPFLAPNFIDACKKISEKNYISVSTNLISGNIRDFATIPRQRIELVRISLHHEELIRTNAQKTFLCNYESIVENSINNAVVIVMYPTLLNQWGRIFRWYMARGIFLRPKVYEGLYQRKMYPAGYKKHEINNIIDVVEAETTPEIARTLLESFRNRTRKKYNFVSYYNKKCSAGHRSYLITPQGKVHRCMTDSREIYNILDKEYVPKIVLPPICPHKVCACHSGSIWSDEEPSYLTFNAYMYACRIFRDEIDWIKRKVRI